MTFLGRTEIDLCRNPCAGPSLDGVCKLQLYATQRLMPDMQIQKLRTAFTLNAAATDLAAPDAISLAEFLPESASGLHVYPTTNSIALAGVLTLNHGLRANHTLRSLDLNKPPGDEEHARYVSAHPPTPMLCSRMLLQYR
jgi:protein phosphatase 1 regulatory subunit 37